MDHFLLADRQTPEALALDLTTRIPPNYNTWDRQEQERWLQERAIAAQRGWLLEESSHLLDSFNRDYSSGLLPMVLDLYDSSEQGPSRNTIARGRERVSKPYLSIIGCSTYGSMANHVQNQEHWNNGLWARFALVTSDSEGTWQFWPDPLTYPEELVSRLRFISFDLLPMPEVSFQARDTPGDDGGEPQTVRVVVVTPALTSSKVLIEDRARGQWERYSRAVTFDMLPEEPSEVPARFYASYGRLGTMLIKVAMLLAASDADQLPVVIKACHVYRAQMIVETWRQNLEDVLAEAGMVRATRESQQSARRIVARLAEGGREWTTRRDLLRSLSMRWSEVEATINDLEESGEIERRDYKPSRGKASEEYRLLVPESEE
jgi:hypothetical protein